MLLFSCEVSLDIFAFGGEVGRKAGSLAPRLVLVGCGREARQTHAGRREDWDCCSRISGVTWGRVSRVLAGEWGGNVHGCQSCTVVCAGGGQ